MNVPGWASAIPLALLLAACAEAPPPEPPPPLNLTGDEIGHYCNMIVVNHDGPKGQVFVQGRDAPYWFTSVLDTFMFTRLPDQPNQPTAIYVTDLGQAQWDQPEPDTWIDAEQALYVVGSDRKGGMGAPELAPFSQRPAAEAFVAEHGGQILAYEEITDERLFEMAQAPPEQLPSPMPEPGPEHTTAH